MNSDSSKSHDYVTKKTIPDSIDKSEEVKGYEYSGPFDFKKYVDSLSSTGNQSTPLSKAIKIVNNMLKEKIRLGDKMKIFLGFTSNIGSSGMREAIRYLTAHKMVDVIATTGGAIEEDIMKTIRPHYIKKGGVTDVELRKKGVNRIYNMLVPNDNYVLFEGFMENIIAKMIEGQEKEGINWTPSKLVKLMGEECEDEASWVHQCSKNNIPVFSPAIIDGSIGDMIYFSQNMDRKLKLDTVEDLCEINSMPIRAEKTGVIILGAGLIKHHILNANLMRNGTEYAVIINMAPEEDGSDAGAGTDEAVTWGKISTEGESVKVFSEVSLVLPTLIASTFKEHEKEFDEMLKKNR